MYRKILTPEKWRWYPEDLLKPLLAAVAFSGFMECTVPENMTDLYILAWLLVASILTLLGSASAAACVRYGLLA